MVKNKKQREREREQELDVLFKRDHVEWDEEQEAMAKEKVKQQLEHPVPEEEQGKEYYICIYISFMLSVYNRAIL